MCIRDSATVVTLPDIGPSWLTVTLLHILKSYVETVLLHQIKVLKPQGKELKFPVASTSEELHIAAITSRQDDDDDRDAYHVGNNDSFLFSTPAILGPHHRRCLLYT